MVNSLAAIWRLLEAHCNHVGQHEMHISLVQCTVKTCFLGMGCLARYFLINIPLISFKHHQISMSLLRSVINNDHRPCLFDALFSSGKSALVDPKFNMIMVTWGFICNRIRTHKHQFEGWKTFETNSVL